MKHTPLLIGALGAAALLAVGCAAIPSGAALDAQAVAMMQAGFKDQGIAKVDRLNRDAVQTACSSPAGVAPAEAKQIEADQLATVKWPAGGQYIGDWKVGEQLAQNGRGMTWTDKSADPATNGAQCYNCHQISKQEISFGTIGPSLYNYGKLRGVKDLNDPAAAPMIQYTWGKIWNAKAYSACSNMPRFGPMHLLTEDQIRHVMALLLDPQSPVNQ